MSIEERYCLQTGKKYICTSSSEDTVIDRLVKEKEQQEQKILEKNIEDIIRKEIEKKLDKLFDK